MLLCVPASLSSLFRTLIQVYLVEDTEVTPAGFLISSCAGRAVSGAELLNRGHLTEWKGPKSVVDLWLAGHCRLCVSLKL